MEMNDNDIFKYHPIFGLSPLRRCDAIGMSKKVKCERHTVSLLHSNYYETKI